MGDSLCPICNRPISGAPRAAYCRDQHRWRVWWERTRLRSEHAQNLPLAPLPPGADALLPSGPERSLAAIKLLLIGKAPAGAKGYRVGIKHARSQIMLWFPAVKHCPLGMFLLEPFQWPEVAVAGTYAVVYMDRRFKPIGGPRFTIAITHTDKRLHYSDGDRTFKPRPRG